MIFFKSVVSFISSEFCFISIRINWSLLVLIIASGLHILLCFHKPFLDAYSLLQLSQVNLDEQIFGRIEFPFVSKTSPILRF